MDGIREAAQTLRRCVCGMRRMRAKLRSAAPAVVLVAMATMSAMGEGAELEAISARRAPAGAVVAVPAPGFGDERRFMHGIDFASAGEHKSWVFFSSSGLPPRGANRDGSWPHDVYVGEWSPGAARLSGVHIFISRDEAQEPVSVAQNSAGNIFVSFEDGWNAPRTVSQRYGVYRADLSPIRPYPQDVESGGHSGHVTAVGERFVVFYSADWVDGGGVDNLGTGGGVYVMALALSADSITLRGLQRAPFSWGNTGAIGIPAGADTVHFVSLTPGGLREADFNAHREVDLMPAVPPELTLIMKKALSLLN